MADIEAQVTFTCSICGAMVTERRTPPDYNDAETDWWARHPPEGWERDRCTDCVNAIEEATQAAIQKRRHALPVMDGLS